MAGMAEQIDRYLRGKGSPLAGYGSQFVASGSKHGIDPRLMVAIAGSETNFGKYGPAQRIRNAWGYGPHISFPSWEAGIDKATWNLSSPVYAGRNTIGQIASKWAPVGASNDPNGLNNNWGRNVSKFYSELGGNPGASIRIGKGTLPASASAAPAAARGAAPQAPASAGVGLADEEVRLPDAVLAKLAKWVGDSEVAVRQGRDLALPEGTLEAIAQARAKSNLAKQQNRQALLAGGGQAAPVQQAQTAGHSADDGHDHGAMESGTLGKLLGKPIDRPGMATKPGIMNFARRIAGLYGPLQLGTGTQHNRMTLSGNVSAHWSGNALDLPATGSELTRMGRMALIAAGMPKAQAMKQTGGVYNLNGYQILFNTRVGGNHYNHTHIGLRR